MSTFYFKKGEYYVRKIPGSRPDSVQKYADK